MLRDYDFSSWFYGMWVAVASGIADGMLVGGLLNLQDPKDWNAQQTRFWNLLLPVVGICGLKAFFFYLKQNPAPKVITHESTKTMLMPSGAVSVEQKLTTTPVVEPPAERDTK